VTIYLLTSLPPLHLLLSSRHSIVAQPNRQVLLCIIRSLTLCSKRTSVSTSWSRQILSDLQWWLHCCLVASNHSSEELKSIAFVWRRCEHTELGSLLVFKGPVHRTKKRPKSDWTEPIRTGPVVYFWTSLLQSGCWSFIFKNIVGLQKDWFKSVATG